MHPLLTPILLLAATLGLILCGAGLWVLKADGSRRRFSSRTSDPTRYTVGLCLLIGGYHLLGYAVPDAWLPLKVPRERWYLVPTGIVLALGLSFAGDSTRRMSQEGNDPSGTGPDDRNIM